MNNVYRKIGWIRALLYLGALGCIVTMNLHGSLESGHTLMTIVGVTGLFISPEVMQAMGWIKK